VVAVVLLAGLGAGTAVAVTAPPRTRLPGLHTPPDGRWSYPALSLPTLPAGVAAPSSADGYSHQADLRPLLLPEPIGATADHSFPGAGAWYPESDFVHGYSTGQPQLAAALGDYGVRHIAARAWTTPDGTHTELYLMGFRSTNSAADTDTVLVSPQVQPPGIGDLQTVSAPDPRLTPLAGTVRSRPAGGGHPAVTVLLWTVGDTDALLVLSHPREVPLNALVQTALLQNELLH
jgi:hypothetical protein